MIHYNYLKYIGIFFWNLSCNFSLNIWEFSTLEFDIPFFFGYALHISITAALRELVELTLSNLL